MDSTTIYQDPDVIISKDKAVIRHVTYFLANITTVRVQRIHNREWLWLLAIGIGFAICRFFWMWSIMKYSAGGFLQCFLALIVAAVGVYYYHTPMALVIETNSGFSRALRGKPGYLFHVRSKIEEAIVASKHP